jgi:hypothetical protein
VQTDDQGEIGRKAGASASHRGVRHTLIALAVLVTAALGLVAATNGWTSAEATSAGQGHSLPGTPVTPPPTSTPVAPGTEVTGGADQSDPFLTIAAGRYLLLTSGGTGPTPVNVPVAISTDFTRWTEPVDALPVLPVWAQPGYTWAPDLHRFGSQYALYFTSMVKGVVPQTQCIGSAFAGSPTGPFTARPAPLICQLDLGGSIDPRVFVDADGSPWMLWKSDQNIGGSNTPTTMWSQRLSADGTELLGHPSALLTPDEGWQGTIVEAPDLVEVDGVYWIVYSANWYNQPSYAIGVARCAGPAGPCRDQATGPLLASNFQGDGPGEASVFRDDSGVWLLYSPWRSLAPKPDIPPRPVYITRLGFGPLGPHLAAGPLPGVADLLAWPLWSPTS